MKQTNYEQAEKLASGTLMMEEMVNYASGNPEPLFTPENILARPDVLCKYLTICIEAAFEPLKQKQK